MRKIKEEEEYKDENLNSANLNYLKSRSDEVLIQLQLDLLDAIDESKIQKSKEKKIYSTMRLVLYLQLYGVLNEEQVNEFIHFFTENV